MMRSGKAMLNVGVALTLALTTACSGGQEENTSGTPTGDTGAAQPAVAGQASSAPAADDTTTLTGVTLAEFTPDAAAGESAFVQCQTCHAVEPGVNRIGPSVHGIVGREAGTVPDYNYTPANANSGIVWTPEKLFQYLENPQRVIPGTKMAFGGITDPQQRANLIAWLETQS